MRERERERENCLNDYSFTVKLRVLMFIIVLKETAEAVKMATRRLYRLVWTIRATRRYCLIKIMSDKFSLVCSARFIR